MRYLIVIRNIIQTIAEKIVLSSFRSSFMH
jgi:hypothetical protein